ncbi:MAG: helicase, partial [Proteobacteria bacterium]|nr:helicase [Pseudomonadota bacterium]
MHDRPNNPLIVQGDGKILLETKHPQASEAREFLNLFAELKESPPSLHTFEVNDLSLWNAACSGLDENALIDKLAGFSKYVIPREIEAQIRRMIRRYGMIKLLPHPKEPQKLLRLYFLTPYIAKKIADTPSLSSLMVPDINKNWAVPAGYRGLFKQRSLQAGWPVEDLVGFEQGEPLDLSLRKETKSKEHPFAPRDYQWEAANRWFQDGRPSGGCGVVVLACGAGKTIVGLTAMSLVKQKTLILANNQTAVDQWIREIIDKTGLDESMVGSYTAQSKEIRPITVATYQILTWRRNKNSHFEHIHLFNDGGWGLIIYDEVHLLPAPVFGATASIQGKRRLGLTATLIREDGREGDVFSLVGPKVYDLPWRSISQLAEVLCHEIRVPVPTYMLEDLGLLEDEDTDSPSKEATLNNTTSSASEHGDEIFYGPHTKKTLKKIEQQHAQALLNKNTKTLTEKPTASGPGESTPRKKQTKAHIHRTIVSNPVKIEIVK